MNKPVEESGRLKSWISWQSIFEASKVLRERKAAARLKYGDGKPKELKRETH